ncbi:MAG: hypothetical protein A3C06_02455 [Candidatus Taylorbacteria bacterium RIFCSPHIGHO2_02_FULL_46_13]|uniref:DUF2268 domain-containing protein n=1 Tax=Candidatus Taylorbacteria bacterium RIFCSPHIGHO2_02_FULL_46_13 TaxID=1802312 RepID=A0A1G2MQW0_9BACT|nr:MAG: hypothetical protein A3C06_02455 [Candidatus Taylorbacteria bacterium RIFCSPHIGHO2_02_FULL_46_13]
MKTKEIKSAGKTIADIYLQGSDPGATAGDKKRLVSHLSKDIKETDIGYAGFSTKDALNSYLMSTVFDEKETDNEIFNFALDEKKIVRAIKEAVVQCSNKLPTETVHIFVFPTFSKFVKEKMFGTTGYTPWKDTILVFVNPLNQYWERALTETIGHEYGHSVSLRYNKCESLLDSIIFEGLAEHFREQAVGDERAPWTKVLGINQSRSLFLEMELGNLLQSTDKKVYRAVFFGNEKYARWTGYSVGYHLVESFVTNNPNLKWQEIIKMRPKDIFDRAHFK